MPDPASLSPGRSRLDHARGAVRVRKGVCRLAGFLAVVAVQPAAAAPAAQRPGTPCKASQLHQRSGKLRCIKTSSGRYLWMTAATPASATKAASAANATVIAGSTSVTSRADTNLYVTDRRIMAPVFGALPAKGETRTDPGSGAGVTRIADHSELKGNYGDKAPSASTIVYSRHTPANTTNELVIVHGNDSTSAWVYRVKDHSMVTVLRMKPSLGTQSRALGEVNELRWDYSGAHPYRLYFVGHNISDSQAVRGENVSLSFYSTDIDPQTGLQSDPELIRDFSDLFPTEGKYPTGGFAGATIMNDVEGDSSIDSRYWVWMVMNTELGSGYLPYAFITYDKTANKVVGRMQRSCAGVPQPCTTLDTPAQALPYLTRPNMVDMSPLGTRVVLYWERAYPGNHEADVGTIADGPHATRKDYSDPIRVGVDATHSGWAWGPGGEEMLVYQNNRNDYVEAVDVATSHTAGCSLIPNSDANSFSCGVKVFPYGELDDYRWNAGSIHFGKVYDRSKRGWLYMNTGFRDNSSWGYNQNLFIQIRPYDAAPKPTIWRVAPTFNVHHDYLSEGFGALNFQASAIYISANWGSTSRPVEAYRIGLPPDWHQQLQARS